MNKTWNIGKYSVEQRGDFWIVYAGPGRSVHSGDAESTLEWLAKHTTITTSEGNS